MAPLHASLTDSPARISSTAPTALIVDDEPHVRAYLRLSLQALGIAQIWESSGGPETLALYAQHWPVFVLLDVNMPTIPGAEMLEKLIELDPDVAAIVVTSDSGHHTVRRFLDLGAMGYVLKQRPPEELRDALREIIGRIIEAEAN